MNILNLVKYKTKSQIFNACCKLATHISAPKRLFNYHWTKYLYLQKLLTLLELRYMSLKYDKSLIFDPIFFKRICSKFLHLSFHSVLLTFVISLLRFCNIQNFMTEFWILCNFGKFELIIQKRWRWTKMSISELPIFLQERRTFDCLQKIKLRR